MRKAIEAIRDLLRSFRIRWNKPVPAKVVLKEVVHFQTLPVERLEETADREILLASREPHAIQDPSPQPGQVESAAGFPLHIYKEMFQSGPAQHATFVHVCKTKDSAPLLIHSTPRNRCKSPSSSPRATNHPTS